MVSVNVRPDSGSRVALSAGEGAAIRSRGSIQGNERTGDPAKLLDRALIWAENAQYPAVPVSLLGLNFFARCETRKVLKGKVLLTGTSPICTDHNHIRFPAFPV